MEITGEAPPQARRAKALMVLGTGSHVGKSLLTAALCRIFAEEGYRVAPFKSQNMSLNSAATPDGLEIGRAQALQAEAAGIAPSVHMNPILLKPCGEMRSQVVVRGKIWGTLRASDYHLRRVHELLPIITESYEILAGQNDVVILEGAGSPAEINLKQHDIVNMRMAELAGAACLLVGDIDRGGVFASLLGTVLLLDPQEQDRVRGFLINKFRGDVGLLQPGVTMMEERMGKPCLGVVPYLPMLQLEEEDSLSLQDRVAEAPWRVSTDPRRLLRVAVVALPSFSNFTDFDSLRSEPSVDLRFCSDAGSLAQADIVVLPGSKQTMDDLQWLRGNNLDSALVSYLQSGLLVGICGGYQMLGEDITDPHGVERAGTVRGLSLLSVRTVMQQAKITRVTHAVTVTPRLFGQRLPALRVSGYEIHVGTSSTGDAAPFARLNANEGKHMVFDGCVSEDSRVFGTYLHGVFDEDEFRHGFIAAARSFHQLAPASALDAWSAKRADSFDRLTAAVRAALDIPRLFSWVELPYPGPRRQENSTL